MKTSKELKSIIAQHFPRVPEEEKAKEKALAALKAEGATARDVYIVVRLLEHHIEYQDLIIAWLCRQLVAAGIPIGQQRVASAAPTAPQSAPDANDGGASWVMAGINPDDKTLSPQQQAAGGPADGGASWVMAGVENDGPAPAPPPVSPTNGGSPPVSTPQILPNVKATGGAQPPEIAALFAAQAMEQDQAKNKPKGA